MSTVLILMSHTGGGHRSVAQALAGALKHLQGDNVEVVVADPFAIGSRTLVDRLTHLYSPLIVRYPWLWGVVYHLTNNRPVFESLMGIGSNIMEMKMGHLFTSVRPDVIVSVHPLCNYLASHTRHQLGWSVPIMTVITDLVSVHAGWMEHGLDLYAVPTSEAEKALADRGVQSPRLRLLGLPIDQKFGHPRTIQEESRRSLGIDEEKFTVLALGGGEGAGHLYASVEALSQIAPAPQLLVVCGHNDRLRRKLKARFPQLPGQIHGFVHNMPELMNAADVVVTKAGSVTIAESLAMRRPIILTDVLPGQEDGNVAFVKDNNVGMRARSCRELVEQVQYLLANDTHHQSLQGNTLKIGKPEAAVDTAKAVVSLIPGSRKWEMLGQVQPRAVRRPVVWLGAE